MVGLSERADSKVGDYSHGMKQRLGIANALINSPELSSSTSLQAASTRRA